MNQKEMYWWAEIEDYKFIEDHEGDCEACGTETTLTEDNVCEKCHIIFMNEMDEHDV